PLALLERYRRIVSSGYDARSGREDPGDTGGEQQPPDRPGCGPSLATAAPRSCGAVLGRDPRAGGAAGRHDLGAAWRSRDAKRIRWSGTRDASVWVAGCVRHLAAALGRCVQRPDVFRPPRPPGGARVDVPHAREANDALRAVLR